MTIPTAIPPLQSYPMRQLTQPSTHQPPRRPAPLSTPTVPAPAPPCPSAPFTPSRPASPPPPRLPLRLPPPRPCSPLPPYHTLTPSAPSACTSCASRKDSTWNSADPTPGDPPLRACDAQPSAPNCRHTRGPQRVVASGKVPASICQRSATVSMRVWCFAAIAASAVRAA